MASVVYLYLKTEEFDKQREAAKKRAIDAWGEEDGKDNLLWELQLTYQLKESPEFKDGKMTIGGETEIGYVSIDFELGLDIVVAIIEFYQKRLNKLKTVLEGVK